jgi:hypothetical protein
MHQPALEPDPECQRAARSIPAAENRYEPAAGLKEGPGPKARLPSVDYNDWRPEMDEAGRLQPARKVSSKGLDQKKKRSPNCAWKGVPIWVSVVS